jgi:hypothetical protein
MSSEIENFFTSISKDLDHLVIMASNDACKRRKMSQDIVKQSATLHPLPWQDITPDKIAQYCLEQGKSPN